MSQEMGEVANGELYTMVTEKGTVLSFSISEDEAGLAEWYRVETEPVTALPEGAEDLAPPTAEALQEELERRTRFLRNATTEVLEGVTGPNALSTAARRLHILDSGLSALGERRAGMLSARRGVDGRQQLQGPEKISHEFAISSRAVESAVAKAAADLKEKIRQAILNTSEAELAEAAASQIASRSTAMEPTSRPVAQSSPAMAEVLRQAILASPNELIDGGSKDGSATEDRAAVRESTDAIESEAKAPTEDSPAETAAAPAESRIEGAAPDETLFETEALPTELTDRLQGLGLSEREVDITLRRMERAADGGPTRYKDIGKALDILSGEVTGILFSITKRLKDSPNQADHALADLLAPAPRVGKAPQNSAVPPSKAETALPAAAVPAPVTSEAEPDSKSTAPSSDAVEVVGPAAGVSMAEVSTPAAATELAAEAATVNGPVPRNAAELVQRLQESQSADESAGELSADQVAEALETYRAALEQAQSASFESALAGQPMDEQAERLDASLVLIGQLQRNQSKNRPTLAGVVPGMPLAVSRQRLQAFDEGMDGLVKILSQNAALLAEYKTGAVKDLLDGQQVDQQDLEALVETVTKAVEPSAETIEQSEQLGELEVTDSLEADVHADATTASTGSVKVVDELAHLLEGADDLESVGNVKSSTSKPTESLSSTGGRTYQELAGQTFTAHSNARVSLGRFTVASTRSRDGKAVAVRRHADQEWRTKAAAHPRPADTGLASVESNVSHEQKLDWRDRAACRDHDPEKFFPVGSTGPALEQQQAAKAICNTVCPVRRECLYWALGTGQEGGIWGGMTEDERRSYRRNGGTLDGLLAEPTEDPKIPVPVGAERATNQSDDEQILDELTELCVEAGLSGVAEGLLRAAYVGVNGRTLGSSELARHFSLHILQVQTTLDLAHRQIGQIENGAARLVTTGNALRRQQRGQ